jgi:predicted DNA-binding transcriptional regulator AlpA
MEDQMTSAFNPDAADRFLPARQVSQRYGISDMTLWRWIHNGPLGFPPPIYIGRFRYWRAADLIAWEGTRVARRSAEGR